MYDDTGAPLQWNDKCRIKHLPSHLYAAVVPISGAEDRYKVMWFLAWAVLMVFL